MSVNIMFRSNSTFCFSKNQTTYSVACLVIAWLVIVEGFAKSLILILKIFISDGHIDDNFLEKNLFQPELEPQISSFPYWRLNHLGHCDTLPD